MSHAAMQRLKGLIVALCVVQCLVLSAQGSFVVLDQIRHLFEIDHAPNAIAGVTFKHVGHDTGPDLDHHGSHRSSHRPGHHHDTAGDPPTSHHHAGEGMLAPWFGVATYELAQGPVSRPSPPPATTAHDTDFYKRHDRPPKSTLAQV